MRPNNTYTVCPCPSRMPWKLFYNSLAAASMNDIRFELEVVSIRKNTRVGDVLAQGDFEQR